MEAVTLLVWTVQFLLTDFAIIQLIAPTPVMKMVVSFNVLTLASQLQMDAVIHMLWMVKNSFTMAKTREKTTSPTPTPMPLINIWSITHILAVINGLEPHGPLIRLSIKYRTMVMPFQQQPVRRPM